VLIWDYADKDTASLAILRKRVQETDRKFSLISYTDLVKGVEIPWDIAKVLVWKTEYSSIL
jgi:hypothetical protein